jgi:hypothetical protein
MPSSSAVFGEESLCSGGSSGEREKRGKRESLGAFIGARVVWRRG